MKDRFKSESWGLLLFTKAADGVSTIRGLNLYKFEESEFSAALLLIVTSFDFADDFLSNLEWPK